MRGAFWSLAGAIIARGLALAVAIPVGRHLGREALGSYGVLQATVAMFGLPASFAAGLATTKYIAEFRQDDPDRARRVMALALILGVLAGSLSTAALALTGPWLASGTLGDAALGPLLQGGSILVILNGISLAQSSSLAGLEAFRQIARTSAILGTISAPILLSGTLLFGLRGAVGALVISQALTVVINQMVLRKVSREAGISTSLAGWTVELHTVARFSLPLVATGLLSAPITWACSAMLVNSEDGYSEMGLVNAGAPFFAIVVFLGASLSHGIFPGLADAFARTDRVSIQRMVRALMLVTVSVSVPLAIAGAIASPWLIGLYGPQFRNGWAVVAITFATGAVYCFHLVFSQLLLAAGAVGRWFWLHLGWSGAQVALTYLMLRWGAVGFTSARLGSFLLAACLGALLVLPRVYRKDVASQPSSS